MLCWSAGSNRKQDGFYKMRRRFERTNALFHRVGGLLRILGVVLLAPLIMVAFYWGRSGDGLGTLFAFTGSAAITFGAGMLLRRICPAGPIDTASAMLLCAVSWLLASAFGALPLIFGVKACCLDAYFETMSGFTTTGITMFQNLESLPRSIIFWRALTQWLGGIGIISFFLAVTSSQGNAHHLLGAESHKISSGRLTPGLFSTLKILWSIYTGMTLAACLLLTLEGMPLFDAVCHSFTTLSTGGFSPYDASIDHYRQAGYTHYRLIEYTITLFMFLGGINFLVHYRVITGDIKAIWDSSEIRHWWVFIAAAIFLVMLDHAWHHSATYAAAETVWAQLQAAENLFRRAAFQVVAIITTTGFVTQDIGSDFFPPFSKQIFLVMMVTGGCVGSTSGGLKILRVVILEKMMGRELFRTRAPRRSSSSLIIDNHPISDDEAHRVAALFFTWAALLVAGGMITAGFSEHGPWTSFSGMFSALGNIGPKALPALQRALKRLDHDEEDMAQALSKAIKNAKVAP